MQDLKVLLDGVKGDTGTAAVLGAAACGVVGVLLLLRTVSRGREVERKIQRARSRRTEVLQRADQAVLRYRQTHSTADSASILALPLAELREKLQTGSLSPEDVLYTYMEQTLAVNAKLNCCTEIIMESFDQLKTIGSNKDGLLYGVPISLKENISYKNYTSTCGMVKNLDKPAQKDSVLVEVLKKQGAIPFAKTNVPQALLSYDCSNPIYGETKNPCNPKKSPGGSSGGEGALITAGGSVLGLGTDIGGSVRIPASFCGICGFKPTAGRLSSLGVNSSLQGQKSVLTTPGPMARDVDSLALFMQAVLCDHMFELDPTVPPLPFNMQTYKSSRPLRIGYYDNDGYSQPSPSMARAVREVKALLEDAGHTLVPYLPLKLDHTMTELLLRGLFADGGVTLLEQVKGGPMVPGFALQILPYRIPNWIKKFLSLLIKPVSSRVAGFLSAVCGVGSPQNVWKNQAAVAEYTNETISYWRKINIDVLLCPMIGPAYWPRYAGKSSTPLSYSMIYNLLNFSAGTVTVSTVTEEDEEELKHFKGIYQDFQDRLFKEAVTGGVGLPVSVQCVSLPWQDEMCLRLMKEVEELVRSRK
ncbi:fatty-acid amide hydrolase 1 [Gouania willdenowi]|uniref:Fatty-acid amide hydrolase 1 n=1 Tax=Gouania willdenowi TaxID=441366 RepID=A0A8C5D8B9_GOUWI|nr:fatty-acid amide hydrolase 1 [Gouania willdenowi]